MKSGYDQFFVKAKENSSLTQQSTATSSKYAHLISKKRAEKKQK